MHGKSVKESLVPLEEFLKQRSHIIMSYWGATGIGKSYLALTAPPPIYFLSFEPEGPRWALKTALENGVISNGDIKVTEVIYEVFGKDPPIFRTVEEEQDIIDFIEEWLNYLFKHEDAGTIVLDTGTTLWTTIDEAKGEEIRRKRAKQGQSGYQFDYRYANRAYRNLIEAVRASGFNCIIPHHQKQKYNSKSQPTGKYEFSGNGRLPEQVDVHLKFMYESADKEEELNELRYVRVEKCRMDSTKVGVEIENPTFEKIFNTLTKDLKRS